MLFSDPFLGEGAISTNNHAPFSLRSLLFISYSFCIVERQTRRQAPTLTLTVDVVVVEVNAEAVVAAVMGVAEAEAVARDEAEGVRDEVEGGPGMADTTRAPN